MTEFIESFQRRIDLNDFEIGFEKELYNLYCIDEVQNKYWLIQKFFEYNKVDSDVKYYILLFIKYLGEKNKFNNDDVVENLKFVIQNYFEKEIGEFNYLSDSLETILYLNKDNIKFLQKIFKKYSVKIGENINLLRIFLNVFAKSKINDFCFEVIILMLKNEHKAFYEFDIWEYFNGLEKDDFVKYILKLFKIFTSEEEKKYLVDLGKYVGLVKFSEKSGEYLEYELDNKKIIDNLLLKIKSNITSDKNLKIIRNFLFSDLDTITFRYQDITKNYFDMKLFSFLREKDNNIIYEYLKHSNLSNLSYSNPRFIYNQLDQNNIGKCIELYTQKTNFFLRIYILIKENNNKLLNLIKENKKFYEDLKLIEKQSIEEQNKWEKEEEKRRQEQKKGIIDMTGIDEGYYPKLLQDYYNMINDKATLDKFSIEEKEKLNEAVEQQSLSCLKSIDINDYNDEKIKNIVVFEENGEGSYSVSWFVHYLYRILNISKFVKFSISKYYKEFVLLYPLIFGDDSQRLFLDFLEGKIKSDDIDYILKVYNEDLHENAVGLRFYNPSGLGRFYEKFKSKFSSEQKDKLKRIMLEFIESDKIIYKDKFIGLYAELIDKEEFINIYHEPTINYFKSIISNEIPVSEEEKIEFDKQLKINEILITKFKDKNALLWRIQQIKDGVVKFNNPYALKRGEFIGKVHGVSALENELEFMRDNERNFYYFVCIKNTIDIKDEMLEILELGLKIDLEIKNGSKEKDYKAYSTYLINIFFLYVKNLENKKRYYKQTMKIIDEYPENSLEISSLKVYFGVDRNDNSLLEQDNCYKYKKKITTLENENVHYKSELNKLREILGVANPKCIIFVEGLTDKRILETACRKLGKDDLSLVVRSAGGARALEELIKGFICDSEYIEGVKIIAIFDSDKEGIMAYHHISQKKFSDKNISNNLCKNSKMNIYSMTLPVPKIYNSFYDIKNDDACFITIESLFDTNVFIKRKGGDLNNNLRLIKYKNTAMYVVDSSEMKREFSKFVNNLEINDFKHFKPLIDQIEKIINGEYNN